MNDVFLNSSNAPYVAELFFKFKENPSSIDSSWLRFFNSLNEDEISILKDFGGPIMIAQLAGQTAEAGLMPFLTFMALLSVNLALLNILPIPGLDGGHIFLHLIEAIIRRPLTLKTRIAIQQIGMAFILMLMVTIIFQDISRLFN